MDGVQPRWTESTTIGYFSQDVGAMSGRTVVEETMAGEGEVASAMHDLVEIQAGLADAERADELDDLLSRLGDAQARFEQLGGYALEAGAREILAGAASPRLPPSGR